MSKKNTLLILWKSLLTRKEYPFWSQGGQQKEPNGSNTRILFRSWMLTWMSTLARCLMDFKSTMWKQCAEPSNIRPARNLVTLMKQCQPTMVGAKAPNPKCTNSQKMFRSLSALIDDSARQLIALIKNPRRIAKKIAVQYLNVYFLAHFSLFWPQPIAARLSSSLQEPTSNRPIGKQLTSARAPRPPPTPPCRPAPQAVAARRAQQQHIYTVTKSPSVALPVSPTATQARPLQ